MRARTPTVDSDRLPTGRPIGGRRRRATPIAGFVTVWSIAVLAGCDSGSTVDAGLEVDDSSVRPGDVIETRLVGLGEDVRAGSEAYLLSTGPSAHVEWILHAATEPSLEPESATRVVDGQLPGTFSTLAFPADIPLYFTVPAQAESGEYRLCRGRVASSPSDSYCVDVSVNGD